MIQNDAMKKILVPTDFSSCAMKASDVAMQIAGRTNAEVHFYTRVHVHPLWDSLSEKEKLDFPESMARIQLTRDQFRMLRERYRGSNVRIVTSFSHGDLVEVVSRYIDDEDIFLIVMGSHGADGIKEYLFGSNAQKIVRHAHRPVLVIKEGEVHSDFRSIIFASDFQESTKAPFKELIEFGRHFGSHIHLVNISTYWSMEQRPEIHERMLEFENMCKALPCHIHESGDINIESGIGRVARTINADLVTVAHFGKKPIRRIFTGSITEALVNHLDIPVLTLNYPELEAWHLKHVSPGERVA